MRLLELLEAYSPLASYYNSTGDNGAVRNLEALITPEEQLEFLATEMSGMLKNCSQIISIYKQANGFLYRGMKHKPIAFESNIRTDRSTVEMHPEYAKALVRAYNALGIKAHRQNSIFTTPDRHKAHDWGNAYIVFPQNGFSFSYFTEIKSNYAYYRMENAAAAVVNPYDPHNFATDDEDIASIVKVMKELGITDKNLTYAIQQECEVLITGAKFYAFSIEWQGVIRKWIGL